jgi:DDE_Tnp_1-associated
MPGPCSSPAVLRRNFRKKQAGTSRSSPRSTGGMIPVVTPDRDQNDKRKGKTLSWREAKISLAHAKGSRTLVYRGGIEAGAEAAGRRLFACAVRAGFGADSRVHAVGDGAPWIVGQIEERFGEQGSYLIDFYHVCEYLSAAAKTIAPDAVAGKVWIETQKDALKTGRVDAVLKALAPHREALDVIDDQAPVRVCHRYLDAREDQLKYREALAEGLPIGSGEIESAHRYVAQKRLKLPGAWWLVEHAEHMLALRINRLNGDWEAYWTALAANPPANDNRSGVSPNLAACARNFGSHPAMEDVTADRGALVEAVVFLNHFKDMPDPRQRGKVTYPLDEVLLLALLAVLAGAESFVDIARFGRMELAFLRRFRPFLDGTPSHDHLGDIFAALDAEHFQRCFVAWVASLIGVPAGVVAIRWQDGASIRWQGRQDGARSTSGRCLRCSDFRSAIALGSSRF